MTHRINLVVVIASLSMLMFSSHLYLQSCTSYSIRNLLKPIGGRSPELTKKNSTVASNVSTRYVDNFIPSKDQLFGPIVDRDDLSFNFRPVSKDFNHPSLSRGLKHTVQIRDWERQYKQTKKTSGNSGIRKTPYVYVTGEYSLLENTCFLNSGRLRLLWPIKDRNYTFNYSASQGQKFDSELYQHAKLPLYELDIVDADGIFDYSDRSVKRKWKNSMTSIDIPGNVHYWLLPYDTPNCWHGFFEQLLPQFRTLLYLMKDSASSHIFPFDAWFLTQGRPSPEHYFSGFGSCHSFLATVLRGFLTFYSGEAASSNWAEIPFPALYFGYNETDVQDQIICFDRLVYRGSGHNTSPSFSVAETLLFSTFRQRLFTFLRYSSSPHFPHRGESIHVTRHRPGIPIRIVIHDRLDSSRRRWQNADELIQSFDPQLIRDRVIHIRYLPSMGTTLSAWDQIGLHLTCDLLISVHGANMVLTMFMPENSSVIQVGYHQYLYPFMGDSHSDTSIAATFSLHQYAVPAISVYPSAAGSSDPNSLDIIVPPKMILQKIKAILGFDVERKWNRM